MTYDQHIEEACNMVGEFQEKIIGVKPLHGGPSRCVNFDWCYGVVSHIGEELEELADAQNCGEKLDALADISYLALGLFWYLKGAIGPGSFAQVMANESYVDLRDTKEVMDNLHHKIVIWAGEEQPQYSHSNIRDVAMAALAIVRTCYRVCHEMEKPFWPVLMLVHDANMKKHGTNSPEGKRCVKPEGWVAPDFSFFDSLSVEDMQEFARRVVLHKAGGIGAAKNDRVDNKPNYSAIPPRAQMELARIFGYGAKKYAFQNYMKGLTASRYVDAAMRHLNSFLQGEDIDTDSGQHHLMLASANCFMLYENLQMHGQKVDDRFVLPNKDKTNE